MKQFDVIVIGGGHAGCEAAAASARMGATTLLLTMNIADLGVMSCNPAIGGLGKGHLVREIDALDGVMGRAADFAGIQFRLLNRKKGPAVQGPRAQADRDLYRTAVQQLLAEYQHLTIREGEVADLIIRSSTVAGVELASGTQLLAPNVVLTTGTFLSGVIHIGHQRTSGGRMGDRAVTKLGDRLRDLGLPLGRLKTGTPPRLDGRTIAWDKLETQPGDQEPTFFSFLSSETVAPQISCGITHTNERTHDIIRRNLVSSAMYGGQIDSTGPRYCPSIEDKVVRFEAKSSHQVFLEPEGLTSHTVYPNGISTSLPETVQHEYVQSIAGLDHAQILQPGYAIEYDYVDPRILEPTLALPDIAGLFLAGQINGTTGYEEAAAQGLIAGLNAAAQSLGRDQAVIERHVGYIGVLIDDITTNGVTEPYRMFTSRAEYRLQLRIDNADQRLTPWGRDIGCVTDAGWRSYCEKADGLSSARESLAKDAMKASALNAAGFRVSPNTAPRTALEALCLPGASVEAIQAVSHEARSVPSSTLDQLLKEQKYAFYVDRQRKDIEALAKDEERGIPADFTYENLPGLSGELTQKLSRTRPRTLGQASRIEGMTPAALTLILASLVQLEKHSA